MKEKVFRISTAFGEREKEACERRGTLQDLYGCSPLQNGTDYHGQRWIQLI